MLNIVTAVDGRQYLQVGDGSYIEIAVQPVQQPCDTADTTGEFVDYAEVLQPPTTSGILPVNAAQRMEMNQTGSLSINPVELQPDVTVAVQPITEMGLQLMNEEEMHSDNAATNSMTGSQQLNDEAHQIDIKEFEPMIEGDETEDDANKSFTSKQLSDIIARLDRIEPVLQRIVFFMADVERFMKLKSSDRASDHSEHSGKRQFQEDFTEFEALFPIDTEEQLLSFESILNKQDTNDKVFHYFEYVYNLNGKRDSGPFFKALLRKIIVATTVQMYSWKGQSRNNKGLPKSSNKSFKDSFPLFVKFVHRVVRAADYEFTEEANNEAFSVYLRNKNTEIQRHEKGCGEQRVARVGRKKASKPVDAAADGLTDVVDAESTALDEDDSDEH